MCWLRFLTMQPAKAVDQPCYGVKDTKTLIGHECVGMLLKRFLDNLTASELVQVVKKGFKSMPTDL